MATSPVNSVRDGPRALDLAWQAADQSRWKDPEIIDTLAAANAEVRDFDQAQVWERKAISLTHSEPETVKDFQARLALYAKHQPYCEPSEPG